LFVGLLATTVSAKAQTPAAAAEIRARQVENGASGAVFRVRSLRSVI
jgi:hypothetical protein